MIYTGFIIATCAFARPGKVLTQNNGISWNSDFENFWAQSCDWPYADIKPVDVPSEQCSNQCRFTPTCTHYTWNGNTCFLKNGDVTKEDAFMVQDSDHVIGCGILDNKADVPVISPVTPYHWFDVVWDYNVKDIPATTNFWYISRMRVTKNPSNSSAYYYSNSLRLGDYDSGLYTDLYFGLQTNGDHRAVIGSVWNAEYAIRARKFL